MRPQKYQKFPLFGKGRDSLDRFGKFVGTFIRLTIPRSTQPSIPPGSVNEYQLRLGRQRQVWLVPIADERVGMQVKL